ncbi:MAG: WG repeat-containing protein [Bacteroidota bacterium]|nr:WG repeat-containing protein [Bacteroidota bacterium]
MKQYDYIGKVSEGLIRVKNGTIRDLSCGYMNENGQEIIPLIYTGGRDFQEGLAAVKIGNFSTGKWGYINIQGELIIPYLFDKPRSFSGGLAKVIYNNEWCFIDRLGNKVISLTDYTGGSSFHKRYAIVEKCTGFIDETTFGIIDKTGTEVIPCKVKCYQLRSFFCCTTLEESVRSYNRGV